MKIVFRALAYDKRKAVGYLLAILGLAIVHFSAPATANKGLSLTSLTVVGTLLGITLLMNSLVGIFHSHITAATLRWMDLAWIHASVTSLAFAATQLINGSPDENVAQLQARIEQTRRETQSASAAAFAQMCSLGISGLSQPQCEALPILTEHMGPNRYFQQDLVDAACPPPPIELGKSGSPAYDYTCIGARSVVLYEAELANLQQQETSWRDATASFLFAMMFLAPLRLTKSTAETLWGLPAPKAPVHVATRIRGMPSSVIRKNRQLAASRRKSGIKQAD